MSWRDGKDIKELNSECMVKRGRNRDVLVSAWARARCGEQGSMSLLSGANRMACSSLNLMQTQPLTMLPSHRIMTAKVKTGSSEPDLTERPPWSMLSPEATLVPQAMLKLKIHVDICGPTAVRGLLEVYGLCYY